MKTEEDIQKLQPFQARAIIEGLRKGVVPTEYVSFFTVGRQDWLKFVEEDLDHFIEQGGGKVRFINGDYGDGKTHFMSVIQQIALQKKFASSFVVLTRETPIYKFEIVYQEIVSQLRGQFKGVGIRPLIEKWINENKNSDFQKLETDLRQTEGMELSFANALLGLWQLSRSELEEKQRRGQEILHQWFEGKKVSKKDLKEFYVFETLSKTSSKRFLQSLVAFLKVTEHKGLILLLDELETILSQGASTRNAAYENVRLLMDNTEHTRYLELFFSLIPDVLLSEKGFKCYDALWSRVRSLGNSGEINYRSTLIDLHKTPLETKELVNLGTSLRKIHEIAYRWDAEALVPLNLIEKICKQQEELGVLSEVRLFIKQIIRLLDIGEQGNLVSNTDLMQNLVDTQKEEELEKIRHLEPAWDA